MVSFNEVLNFAIPALLVIVAFGFVYVKFLEPYVVPLFIKLWEWLKGRETSTSTKKEILYE